MFLRQRAQVTAWGLGGLMPAVAGADAATKGTAAQFPALASGKTKGGNFERFEDGVLQGFFPRTEAGYLAYLTYNQLGMQSAALSAYPEYVAWHLAGDKAYAVGTRQCGANVPPCTSEQMQVQGYDALRAAAKRHGWDAATLARVEPLFREHFARLVSRIGQAGQGVANAPIVTAPEVATVPLPPPRESTLIPKSWVISDRTDEWGRRTLVYQAPGGPRIEMAGGGMEPPLPVQDVLVLLVAPLPRWMPEADALAEVLGWFVETRTQERGPGIVGEKWKVTPGPVHRYSGYARYAEATPGELIRKGLPGWTWAVASTAPSDVRAALERGAVATPPAKYGFGSAQAPAAPVVPDPAQSPGTPAHAEPAPGPSTNGGGNGGGLPAPVPVPAVPSGVVPSTGGLGTGAIVGLLALAALALRGRKRG